MSRTLKYRAWDSNERTMLFSGSYVDTYTSVDGHKDGVQDDAIQDITRSFIVHPWDSYEGHIIEICYEHDFGHTTSRIFKGNLMQYTGLKDKNGVEIYNKDIVRVSPNQAIGMIRWDTRGYWGVELDGQVYSFASGTDITTHSSKVIGNVYQHPHLLE